MTFAARTFQGANGANVAITSPSYTLQNTSITTGSRTATVFLNADGTSSVSGGTSTGSSTWASPTGTGAGTGVWVSIAVSGSGYTLTGPSGWTQLTSTVSYSLRNTSSGAESTGSFTLTFATDSAGSNIIGTGTGTFDVGYAP